MGPHLQIDGRLSLNFRPADLQTDLRRDVCSELPVLAPAASGRVQRRRNKGQRLILGPSLAASWPAEG